jgi:hypothetical protein
MLAKELSNMPAISPLIEPASSRMRKMLVAAAIATRIPISRRIRPRCRSRSSAPQ